ncbi:MAG: calcium/sodium antiporter [Actinomycetota bacterium]
MALDIIFLVIGVPILAKAADQFVMGSVRVASALRVSAIVIGAVVMGFGTSAPEMVVSGIAAGGGDIDVGVGNIVGSNIANLTLVLGVAGIVTAIVIPDAVLRREAPLSTASLVVFAVLVQDGLRRWEGLVLVVLMVAALTLILLNARDSDDAAAGGELGELLDDDEPPNLPVESLRTLAGLAGTVGGAWLLVEGATGIADEAGLSGGFVGLTLVAVGTSLPELVTTVLAARQGQTDLIVGNLLGSNLFNSLAVGSVTALVGNGPLQDPDLDGVPIYMMLGVGFVAWAFMANGKRIGRVEGAILLIAAFVCVPFLPR